MRRPVKDRDALDLVGEWLACNRAEIAVVELASATGLGRTTWRATLRTALGRMQSGFGISPGAALRQAYTELGYRRTANLLELSEAAA